MGFQTNYTEAIKQVEDLVQIIFEKLSRRCKYCELTIVNGPNHCIYYGEKRIQGCERENCPLLEEEE
jgi:hypothetical protein